jgi:hypothetical protein
MARSAVSARRTRTRSRARAQSSVDPDPPVTRINLFKVKAAFLANYFVNLAVHFSNFGAALNFG